MVEYEVDPSTLSEQTEPKNQIFVDFSTKITKNGVGKNELLGFGQPAPNLDRIDLQEKKTEIFWKFFKSLFQAMKFIGKLTRMSGNTFLDTQTPIEKKVTFFPGRLYPPTWEAWHHHHNIQR